jgi:hypothetical protein
MKLRGKFSVLSKLFYIIFYRRETICGPPLQQNLDCQTDLLHIRLEFATGMCVSVTQNDYYGNSVTSLDSVYISVKIAPSEVKYSAT